MKTIKKKKTNEAMGKVVLALSVFIEINIG